MPYEEKALQFISRAPGEVGGLYDLVVPLFKSLNRYGFRTWAGTTEKCVKAVREEFQATE